MTTRQRVLLSLSAATALGVGLVRCVGSDRAAAPVAQDSAARADVGDNAALLGTPAATTDAVATSGSNTAGDESAGDDSAASRAQLAAVADAGADAATLPADPRANPAASLMQNTDAPDRALLADVERLTKHAPPPAVGELIALHRKGATRPELEQFIKQSFGTNVALRTSTLRWLEQVSPSGKAQVAEAPGLSSTGEPHVKRPAKLPAKTP